MLKMNVVFVALPINGKLSPEQVKNVREVIKSYNLSIPLVITGEQGSFCQITTQNIFSADCLVETILSIPSLNEYGNATKAVVTLQRKEEPLCISDIEDIADGALIMKTSSSLQTLFSSMDAYAPEQYVCVVSDYLHINAMLHAWPKDETRPFGIDECQFIPAGDIVRVTPEEGIVATSGAFASMAQ